MRQFSKENKQVIFLYISTLLGVGIGVITSVINTRFLPPAQYGDVRYVQNIIAFFSSILLFGYFTSGSRLLALSDNEQESRRIRGAMCSILCIAVMCLTFIMLGFYIYSVNKGTENLTPLYLVCIPLCSNALLLGYINTTAQGDNHIGRLSLARLIPSSAYAILAIAIYNLYGCTSVLMLILYNGSAILILGAIIASTKPSFKNLKESLITLNNENKAYGFNIYLGSLLGVSTSYIAGITLGQFCADNSNVGFYTLALTISAPLCTLPSIIGTTYFKRFAKENNISNKVWLMTGGLTAASVIVYVIIIKYIVAILYDSSYSSVATYASWLAIGMGFHGVGDMVNRYLGSHGLGKEIRNAAIACGSIVVVGSTVLVYFIGINGAVITKICSDATYFGVLLYYYKIFVKINVRNLND